MNNVRCGRRKQQTTSGMRVTASNQRPAVFDRPVHESWADLEQTQQEHPSEMERQDLQQQVSDLTNQVGWDRANAVCEENRRIEYEQQLDETREKFERQKTLKEMFINKGKATRAELERLEKYSDPETLSTARIATMVRTRIKRTKKKELQVDYEELQVAYIKSQEKYEASLQEEKRKNKLLQDELARIRSRQVHETEVLSARQQQADALQREMENERMQKTILKNKYEELLKLYNESQGQLTAELQAERLKTSQLREEFEKFRASQHTICGKYEAEIDSVRQQAETVQQDLKKEVEQKAVLQKAHEELQEAHALSLEQFRAELQRHTDKNECLQAELEKMTISNVEMQQIYEADVNTARQQVEALQQELLKEREAHKATIAEGQIVINDMKAEQDRCCQELEQELSILKQNASEKEKYFEMQLEELKAQLNSQIKLNLDLSAEHEADCSPQNHEEKNHEQCQQEQPSLNVAATEHSMEAEILEDESRKQEEPIPVEPTVSPQAEAPEGVLPTTTKAPSFLKRTRHFLGLRKPESWKKKKERNEE